MASESGREVQKEQTPESFISRKRKNPANLHHKKIKCSAKMCSLEEICKPDYGQGQSMKTKLRDLSKEELQGTRLILKHSLPCSQPHIPE